MDKLSNVTWLHPKQLRIQRFLSSIFGDSWSRKMRSLNSSARSPLTRDLSGLGFTEFSRNIQVSRPLLELCGRHVVMLQMKVPQIALFRQLVDNVTQGFTCSLVSLLVPRVPV